jgi:hypothetical protein
MTPKKQKLLWGPIFFLSGPIFSAELAGKSCRFIDTIFRIVVIDTFSRMDDNCIASSVKLLYLGILYRFIGAGKSFFLVFSIASSVKKILANKIVSLYSIFFSKIVYLYRFNRYIFEYRCPPLLILYLLKVRAFSLTLTRYNRHRSVTGLPINHQEKLFIWPFERVFRDTREMLQRFLHVYSVLYDKWLIRLRFMKYCFREKT